jgi:hypothetical protein
VGTRSQGCRFGQVYSIHDYSYTIKQRPRQPIDLCNSRRRGRGVGTKVRWFLPKKITDILRRKRDLSLEYDTHETGSEESLNNSQGENLPCNMSFYVTSLVDLYEDDMPPGS